VYAYFERFDIRMTKAQAASASHQGYALAKAVSTRTQTGITDQELMRMADAFLAKAEGR
jgi:hypothetical protein